jgi:hypothetical protein
MLVHARAFVADLKTDVVTLADARQFMHQIREVEGWLRSARRLLEPASVESSEVRTDG